MRNTQFADSEVADTIDRRIRSVDARVRAELSTLALTQAGAVVMVIVVALTVANHWMAFEYLRGRMLAQADGLAAQAAAAIAEAVARDAAILAGGVGAAVLMLGAAGVVRNRWRLFVTLLIAAAPMALHAAALAAALLTMWQPEAWVLPAYGTTTPQLASTMVEAIPVLEPWPFIRVVAAGSSALFATILQARLCGLRGWRAAPAAAGLGGLALVTHLTG